jgi:hypothetical protein
VHRHARRGRPYSTGEVRLTATPPADLTPALPELPALASELANIVEAANAIYDGEPPDDQ